MKKHVNIAIFIPHLGCPFDCIFCNQKKIASAISPPAPAAIGEIIAEHLRTIHKNSEIEVAFFGGSFTAINKEVQVEYLEAVQPYIKSGQVNSIRISTRPDCIDWPVLDLLKAYGVNTIELGVQSINDEVLKKSCRGYTADDVFKAAHLIKENNFRLGIQLMVGLPGDHQELDIKSTKLAIALSPDMVRIYPTLVIQDTVLAELYKKDLYMPLSLEEAISITKEMYLHFTANDINVIRMGLHPSEELISGDAVIAGPFHPAFGELVEQAVFYDQFICLRQSALKEVEGGHKLNVFVNPRDMSKMVGNKKQNIKRLKDNWQIEATVKPDSLLELNSIGIRREGDQTATVLSRDEYWQRSGYILRHI